MSIYKQFSNSPSFDLFKQIVAKRKQTLIENMLTENDKDKLFLVKCKINAIDEIMAEIKTHSSLETERDEEE